jgi:hypothetical protein
MTALEPGIVSGEGRAEGAQELKPCLLCLEVVQSLYQSQKSFEAGLLLTNVDGQICKDDAS